MPDLDCISVDASRIRNTAPTEYRGVDTKLAGQYLSISMNKTETKLAKIHPLYMRSLCLRQKIKNLGFFSAMAKTNSRGSSKITEKVNLKNLKKNIW